ncbi:MAG: YtxH domain-containing protein [Mariniphaga sp.]
MNTGKVLLGVLAGVAAGALVGILFAPAKGSRTRKRIYKKGEDYAEGLNDTVGEILESISHKFEQVKAEVAEFAQKGKDKVHEIEKQ